MPKHFLIFQHTDWEGPGQLFLKTARKCDIDLTIIKLWKERIPTLPPYDGLIVLGGTPNVHQENTYKYLKEEKQAIRKSLKDDRPYLGICLGHLLLAEALGAFVGNNYCASIGFIDGFLTRKGPTHPIFKNSPKKFPLFKWHTQTILEPIPRNIDILVTSVECQVEAISVKGRPHIIGVQFDNNSAAVADVTNYLHKGQEWLRSRNGLYINPETIINDAKKNQRILAKHYDQFLTDFIKMT